MKWGFDLGEGSGVGEREGRGGSRGAGKGNGLLDGVGGRAPRLLARVSEVMTAPAIAADPLATVARALLLAERHGINHVPVAWDDGELVGVTCVCDLWGGKDHDLGIQYMKVPVITIGARETVLRAAEVMRDRNVGCLPVLDDNRRLVGVVTEGDLMRVGAIGLDQLPPACMGCGSRHHVRSGVSATTSRAVSYCLRCLGGASRVTTRGVARGVRIGSGDEPS
jgi:CBS domain-containing protein